MYLVSARVQSFQFRLVCGLNKSNRDSGIEPIFELNLLQLLRSYLLLARNDFVGSAGFFVSEFSCTGESRHGGKELLTEQGCHGGFCLVLFECVINQRFVDGGIEQDLRLYEDVVEVLAKTQGFPGLFIQTGLVERLGQMFLESGVINECKAI